MIMERLRGLFRPSRLFPFTLEEIAVPDAQVDALFHGSFRVPAPRFPLHFVARWRRDGSVSGYVHYTRQEPGVYLVGGLCVDPRPYRLMEKTERDLMRHAGSLSRWLLVESTALLPDKLAVFGYTGNLMSLRDGRSTGYIETEHEHLIVQWHAAPDAEKAALVARIAALGPF